MENKSEKRTITDVQDTGKRNETFIIRMIRERVMKMKKECFINHTKAFDKLRHEDLFELMGKLDLFGIYIRIDQTIY